MKMKKLNTLTKKIMIGVLASIMILSLGSCGKKVAFLGSSVVPAASGTVKIKRDKNRNYIVKIGISNLAEVRKLQTSKQTYVVWMLTSKEMTENIGQLNSSENFLSNQLKASFNTVSSSKPVKIFITAENDGATQTPEGQLVLSTNIF
jgi:hypothetical protein